MSSVYRAQDSANGDLEVAVKILNTAHPDAIKRELFVSLRRGPPSRISVTG